MSNAPSAASTSSPYTVLRRAPPSRAGVSASQTLADRVRDLASALGCETCWARSSGPYVLVGLGPAEAFARIVPMSTGAFGLAFRAPEPCDPARASSWDPVLLVDDLANVVEHALVGEGAIVAHGP